MNDNQSSAGGDALGSLIFGLVGAYALIRLHKAIGWALAGIAFEIHKKDLTAAEYADIDNFWRERFLRGCYALVVWPIFLALLWYSGSFMFNLVFGR